MREPQDGTNNLFKTVRKALIDQNLMIKKHVRYIKEAP